MIPRDPIELTDAAKRAMALQDYGRPPEIEGVALVDLKRFTDDGGSFMELARLEHGAAAALPGFECRPEFQRLLKEAEFTFRQAFAFCPYSPEAVFRYVNLLLPLGRFDDALIIAQTCEKLDPNNAQVKDLVKNLELYKTQSASINQARADMQRLEDQVRTQPTNFQAILELARLYMQMQQTGRVEQLLDQVMNSTQAPGAALVRVAQAYAQMGNYVKLERSLERLVQATPESPEAWYDLAAFKANLRKDKEALTALQKALELGAKRRQSDPKQADLLAEARKDERFSLIRQTPEFKQLVPPN